MSRTGDGVLPIILMTRKSITLFVQHSPLTTRHNCTKEKVWFIVLSEPQMAGLPLPCSFRFRCTNGQLFRGSTAACKSVIFVGYRSRIDMSVSLLALLPKHSHCGATMRSSPSVRGSPQRWRDSSIQSHPTRREPSSAHAEHLRRRRPAVIQNRSVRACPPRAMATGRFVRSCTGISGSMPRL